MLMLEMQSRFIDSWLAAVGAGSRLVVDAYCSTFVETTRLWQQQQPVVTPAAASPVSNATSQTPVIPRAKPQAVPELAIRQAPSNARPVDGSVYASYQSASGYATAVILKNG